MTRLFHKVIVLQILKVIACTTCIMCVKEFVIGRCIFHIIANKEFYFLVMMRQAPLMSPKGQNVSKNGLIKLWEEVFNIFNTITL